MFKGALNKILGRAPIPYDEAKKLAKHKDVNVRLKLAQRQDLVPEIFYYLAADRSAKVRLAIAKNIATPRQADLLLSQDDDDSVRIGLAAKIGLLLPGLDKVELKVVQDSTHKIIEYLAQDQAVRVRRILSETLQDIAHVPPDIIRRLARDVELVVCAPVLENSPVLTEEDLINIIASIPVKGAISAISRRQNISQDVTNAISDSNDVEAIAEMLANPSAQIREDTLDALVSRSEYQDLWHEPLVRRPQLSRTAVLRLVEFVADNLVEALLHKTDLDTQTVDAVREEFARRMESAERSRARDEGGPPKERAKQMFAAGTLTNATMQDAAHSGDGEFTMAGLALAANIPYSTVEKIMELPSIKGLIAVCWKAEFDMPTAMVLQKRIAKVPPKDVMGSADGAFPLSEEEMNWQLDFFKD